MFSLFKMTFFCWSITLTLIQQVYAGDYSTPERYAGERTAFGLQSTGCNASVFAQAPEDHSLFLGRQMITKDGENTCDGRGWKIVLDRLDWTTKTFEIVHPVITPPVEIEGGRRLLNAYDPDIVEFRGEYWLTFECVGDGIPGTSTCLVSVDKQSMTVEPKDIYVAIEGDEVSPGHQYTAADPKFLVFEQHLYLYWTAINIVDKKWMSLSTRGTELISDDLPRPHLWARGKGRATPALDPGANVQVWPDADVFSLREINGAIYVTAGAATGSCLTPSIEADGCFSLQISKSLEPLGLDAFAKQVADPNLLPTTSQEYARFIVEPNGGLAILGTFLPHSSNWFKQRPIPQGVTAFPISVEALFGK